VTIFGLIDGNSFYCSCEAAFDPKLRGRAVVVLSNNDGCAIARSAPAKTLGIKMGDPWHLIRSKQELRDVRWYSSNFALYGDISRRVYQVLADRVPRAESYSIDETFLDLTGLPGDLHERCSQLREDVRRITKIPTCIGYGQTKTIAKIGNSIAKSDPKLGGVCDLTDPDVRAGYYAGLPVSEVWGIGGRTTDKLAKAGVVTIADFLRLDPRQVRSQLTVVGARVQAELLGVSCLPLSLMAATRKGIAVTRAFGHPITTWQELREAVAAYATRAGEKLRAEGLQACHMAVFLQTHPHKPDEPWHSEQRAARIEPTSDSMELIAEAARMLKPLWRVGHRYYKAGVVLNDLVREAEQPVMLFATRDPIRSAKVMAAMDTVNARYGRGTIRPLSTGIERGWSTRHDRLSDRYTTQLSEILVATAW
jgi:DNA polymerase V